ncbi:hypothetical protein SEA_YABOI_212 [Streptomyces phage Yaboi]|uniref:Uncharacterized protein n=2 Tax=Streptomyces virus Yaboi TaxID=2846408 RepID=A0A385UKH7_9CAUD|nr:hypothetical protein HWB86_gp110 [Streptomyces phage Yaboi]AYB71009.1 hypothetical protein SEA_YABOI_212 [Streptomyces phage Yaboi]QAY12822.1 hypothetical protein SEA_BOOMERJR_206 [Streptomyces phage BoomerJR]WNM73759.1 hypothetical protein SEA_SOLLERTIA_208 [Streptomyces phage Sollertia]
MLPNPEKYVSIYPYEVSHGSWSVLGTDGYRSQTIQSGFKSKDLAQAWIRVYLENYVKQSMLRGDEEYELP